MELDLLNKKLTREKNDEEIIDLLTASVRFKSANVTIIDAFLVGEDMVMRPDLLSYSIYGNTDNWDVLLKFNAISNPFSIDFEDLILVPELGWMENQMVDPLQEQEEEDVRSQYIDDTKENDIDVKKIKYNKLISDLFKINRDAKFAEYSLPPNLAQPGDQEVTRNGYSVILGNDVTKSK